MNTLTKKTMRRLFYTIEINLILWIAVVGDVWDSSVEGFIKETAIAGFFISALLQHWAYYNLYKASRKEAVSKSGV